MGERFHEAEYKTGPQPHGPCSKSLGPGSFSHEDGQASAQGQRGPPVLGASGTGGRRGEGCVLGTHRAPGTEKASKEPKDN